MITKSIGKIKDIQLGYGGYQDCQVGISVELGSSGWSVRDFRGFWGSDADENCSWSERDQDLAWAKTMRLVRDLMRDAGVSNLSGLVGKPVEVTFDSYALKEWRILKEAI